MNIRTHGVPERLLGALDQPGSRAPARAPDSSESGVMRMRQRGQCGIGCMSLPMILCRQRSQQNSIRWGGVSVSFTPRAPSLLKMCRPIVRRVRWRLPG